jgi:hypothetical protein
MEEFNPFDQPEFLFSPEDLETMRLRGIQISHQIELQRYGLDQKALGMISQEGQAIIRGSHEPWQVVLTYRKPGSRFMDRPAPPGAGSICFVPPDTDGVSHGRSASVDIVKYTDAGFSAYAPFAIEEASFVAKLLEEIHQQQRDGFLPHLSPNCSSINMPVPKPEAS